VPAGVTLTIKPGAALHFAPYVAFIVRGRLVAEGSPTQTIRLTRRDEDTYWGRIVIDETYADNRMTYTEIAYMEGLFVQYSRIQLRHNTIHDLHGDGIAITGGDTIIQGNLVFNIDCPAPQVCEGIHVRQVSSDNPARVLDNHVHHTDDDCLDINEATVIAERNILHHCADKGISVGISHEHGQRFNLAETPPASATLINNLVYSNTYGIAVKDGSFAHVIHNTIVHNEEGLALYEAHDHPGYGLGRASVINTILWNNENAITFNPPIDPRTVLTITYSDIEVDGQPPWEGEGNLNIAPGFRGAGEPPGAVDFHLRDDSPLIDVGQDTGTAIDLDRSPRLIGAAPDIGAYEVQAAQFLLMAWPGDRQIYLTWYTASNDTALASFAISYTLAPQGTMSIVPPSIVITALPTTTRAYTLTNLHNGIWYIVQVEARDAQENILRRSNIVTVMPADQYIYLPIVQRHVVHMKTSNVAP
jgi:parallel beta-helix repeat protein